MYFIQTQWVKYSMAVIMTDSPRSMLSERETAGWRGVVSERMVEK
jgi:hypothetical protein